MEFGRKLKQLRKQKKIKQHQIAARMGITERAYWGYEHEEYEPTASKLTKIADVLDVSTDYLLGRTDNPDVKR
jgi:transcriptional regulator with XRE-family HTH domain